MKVECLWPPKYEEKGLIIRSRKNEMHSVSFSPYDFSRARRLYEAEGIDPFNNHEVFRGIVYSILTRSTSYRGQSDILRKFQQEGLISPESLASRKDLSGIVRGVLYHNQLASNLGIFAKDERAEHQKIFFEQLLGLNFRRTPWQLVFPGQTAGLVKRIPPDLDGINEYHVRFYNDGIVDCEREVDRFSRSHWAGPRHQGTELLETLLGEMCHLPVHTRDIIQTLFGTKTYSHNCIRK